jgi:GntR family transcriptional regulator
LLQEQFEVLRLPGGLPALCTLRVVHAADGRPIEATSMVKAGRLYELLYEFTPEQQPPSTAADPGQSRC